MENALLYPSLILCIRYILSCEEHNEEKPLQMAGDV